VGTETLLADLTDLGQAVEALHGTDAVVHLAAIPAPGIRTPEETYRANVASTFNVFTAATTLGLERVVWASSETTLGLPFERPPDYAPVDEGHTYPETTYSLSKLTGEAIAEQFARWSDLPFIGLRFSNILTEKMYEPFPEYQRDPSRRKWNLWGYVDARDVAQSCRLALEVNRARLGRETPGRSETSSGATPPADKFVIAAADTVMDTSSRELMTRHFPDVPIVKEDLGEFETLLSIDHAKSVLGYAPEYSWRDVLGK
jgi:nucleoside-diphosphate-sugar epimerase